ncbi:glutamate--cysteine ligase [Streptomyces sp. NPDC004327]|uniref:glutamate--cysteine ligase n=1 Tax=Streptomyces sp. NPDC004327 TaxID=3364699 RepID=UPI003688B4C8
MRSVGVEEELLLVDADSGAPLAVSGVLAAAERSAWQHLGSSGRREHELEKELQKEQSEFATKPVTETGELQEELVRIRREAARHAASAGAVVAAVATSPLPVKPSLNVGRRYRWLGEQYGLTAQEQLTCGCHDEEGVAVLDRIRPWLAVLTAMSANSPFWQGEDSGYGSYRSRVWNRWPSAGPVDVFGSADRYHEQVRAMIDTGALRDEGMIYFDARLSATYPTVEVRVADVCLNATTPVLLAALIRGLAETAARAWHDARHRPSWIGGSPNSGTCGPPPGVRVEYLPRPVTKPPPHQVSEGSRRPRSAFDSGGGVGGADGFRFG